MLEKFQNERISKLFTHWNKSYKAEQAKVDFFNKTLICLKNNIAKRSFKSLALHALQGRLKKRADVHRYFKILHKGI